MKHTKLNTNRVSLRRLTDNHYFSTLFGVRLDFSFEKLFAVSFCTADGEILKNIACRSMTWMERTHSGQHFNLIEPNKKKRIDQKRFDKTCNAILSSIVLLIPSEKKDKKTSKKVNK